MHPGTRIRCARAPGDEDDSGSAGQLAVRFRHHGGGALVPGDHRLDGRVPQGVEHVEIAFSGHAEDAVDTLVLKGLDQRCSGGSRHRPVATLIRRYGTGCRAEGTRARRATWIVVMGDTSVRLRGLSGTVGRPPMERESAVGARPSRWYRMIAVRRRVAEAHQKTMRCVGAQVI